VNSTIVVEISAPVKSTVGVKSGDRLAVNVASAIHGSIKSIGPVCSAVETVGY